MVEVYCGDGKGKTTAAIGLAVRAAGCGIPVIFAQFLKDDRSGELVTFKSLPGINVMHSNVFYGFVSQMTDEQKNETRESFTVILDRIEEELNRLADKCINGKQDRVSDDADVDVVVILDEITHACNFGLVDEKRISLLISKYSNNDIRLEDAGGKVQNPGIARIEFVLTGRNPSEAILDMADYVSQVGKVKHPFDVGITARRGIEF